MKPIKFIISLLLVTVLLACNAPQNKSDKEHKHAPIAEVLPHAVIYEVNLRQFTPEGTIEAFRKHLPRLKNLGVDILWLMPVHPISKEKRKGELGSYYAVADYKAVNPEFGSKGDMKLLIEEAHRLGMYVIFDWVANHTGWDNPWIFSNPEWYTKNEAGEIVTPVEDWTDVADLNYESAEMRSAMIEALKYWVAEFDLDGYRCDVAGSVPTDFWEEARIALDSIKHVFMLAEAWEPELLHKAFDANYGWELHHITNEISKKNRDASHIDEYFNEYMTRYKEDDILMNFITNHDENSWNGTEFERYGDGVECMAVFTYLIPGLPLIYTGQEAGMEKRLRFFNKDTVQWNDTSRYNFYRTLNLMKKENRALLAGTNAAEVVRIASSNQSVYAMCREKGESKVIGVFNFSSEEVEAIINSQCLAGNYEDAFSKMPVKMDTLLALSLKPWAYRVFQK